MNLDVQRRVLEGILNERSDRELREELARPIATNDEADIAADITAKELVVLRLNHEHIENGPGARRGEQAPERPGCLYDVLRMFRKDRGKAARSGSWAIFCAACQERQDRAKPGGLSGEPIGELAEVMLDLEGQSVGA